MVTITVLMASLLFAAMAWKVVEVERAKPNKRSPQARLRNKAKPPSNNNSVANVASNAIKAVMTLDAPLQFNPREKTSAHMLIKSVHAVAAGKGIRCLHLQN